MMSASECLLKANNLEMAAMAASPDNRMLYLQAAAEWRRRAHQVLMEQHDPYKTGSVRTAPDASRDASPPNK